MENVRKYSNVIGLIFLGLILIVSLASVFALATDFVLLIFLAMLFGVFLTKTSKSIGQWVPLSYGWNLGIIIIILLGLTFGGLFLFGTKLESRLSQMSVSLDESAKKFDEWLDRYPLAAKSFKRIPFASDILNQQVEDGQGDPSDADSKSNAKKSDADKSDDDKSDDDKSDGTESDQSSKDSSSEKSSTSQGSENAKTQSKDASGEATRSIVGSVFNVIGRMLGTTFGLFANLGVIFFMGVFFAVDPPLYRDGFAKLFPVDQRPRVTEVMDKMANSMFAWLNGRFIAMSITGIGTGTGLLLLGVPMAITIGIVTALLTFVPNIGGLLALLLAMAMGSTQGPMTVLWVLIIYGVLQLIESNVITPLVQQHKTSIPPALLLGFQVVLGALTGFLGLLVATPLLAASLVGVKEFWVKDTLGDDDI